MIRRKRSSVGSSADDSLDRLPDGSLVVPSHYARRYGRGRGSAKSGGDHRSETERDRGRIQYSPYLRRLAGVTQVVSPELTNTRLHSRASHSYKVAMIAREIAENLCRKEDAVTRAAIIEAGGLDITACEAAGLAHDLGHPPFGHAGEQELNAQLRLAGVIEGFEGNAQSLRIAVRLDSHKYDPGLDLTNVTLAAILKYPWVRPQESQPLDPNSLSKFGAYSSEVEFLLRARAAVYPKNRDKGWKGEQKARPLQTLEASIMDLADDIAYSLHDLEDFILEGFLDVREVIDVMEAFSFDANHPFAEGAVLIARRHPAEYDASAYAKALDEVINTLRSLDVPKSDFSREAMVRSRLAVIVGEFFDGIVVTPHRGTATVGLLEAQWHQMQVLKQITKLHLVSTGRMGQIQRAQKVTIARLFEGLAAWLSYADGPASVPERFAASLANAGAAFPRGATLTPEHYRAISDYICSMSDSEAFMRAQWVTGTEVPGMVNLSRVG